MRYEREDLGFSFELPEGWRRDQHNLTLTFYGPNGGLGRTSELIQIQIATIMPQFRDPSSREKFLAEPAASISRTTVGVETNAVVLRRASESEVSVVRDGIQYTIAHANDLATEKAIERLKESARFPVPAKAAAAIRRWSNPRKQALSKVLRAGSPEEARGILSNAGMPPVVQRPGYTMHSVETERVPAGEQNSATISVPQLATSYDIPRRTLNPYTPAEQSKALPKLRGRCWH